MRAFLKRLQGCRRGATAIEYGMIAGLISIAVVGMVSTIGGQTGGMWKNIATSFPTIMN